MKKRKRREIRREKEKRDEKIKKILEGKKRKGRDDR